MDKDIHISDREINLDGMKNFIEPIKLNTNIPFCDIKNIIRRESDSYNFILNVYAELLEKMPTLRKYVMDNHFSEIACITYNPHLDGYDFRFNPIEILNNIFKFIRTDLSIPFIDLDKPDGIKYLKEFVISCINQTKLFDSNEERIKILDEIKSNINSICDVYRINLTKKIKAEVVPKDVVFYVAFKNLVMYARTKDEKYLVYPKEYYEKILDMQDTFYPHKIFFDGTPKKYWFTDFSNIYEQVVNLDESIDIEPYLLSDGDILVAWQIIPAGKLVLNNDFVGRYMGTNHHSSDAKDEALFNLKLGFYRNSPYTNTLIGLYGLSGYVGFSYPNEYLICDKFYGKTNSDKLKYAKDEAIYAAPADRFDVLKKDKKQIAVEKALDPRIKKFNHTTTGSFIDKLEGVVNGPRVSEKTFDEVISSENKILIKK